MTSPDRPLLLDTVAFIDAASATRAGQLPGSHRDPFDRLIAAQALALDCAVVTNDAALSDFGVDVLW